MNKYIEFAAEEARKATCQRSKCGAVVVKDGEIIGRGHNSPPGELESQRRCANDKRAYDFYVTDKTCCMHAEQRAILDALRNHSKKMIGADLYFTRLGKDGDVAFSGEPYCTVCSKLALDVGIKHFALLHENGLMLYDTEEYNDLSFATTRSQS